MSYEINKGLLNLLRSRIFDKLLDNSKKRIIVIYK